VIRRVAAAALLACVALAEAGCPAAPQRSAGTALQLKALPPTPHHAYFVYHVQPGDTLGRLAARFGVPVEQVAEENDLEDPDSLRVGQVLLVPRMEGVEVRALSEGPPRAAPADRRAVDASLLHRGSASARFWWPTAGGLVRRYGDRVRGLPEPGIGVSAPAGTEVYSVDSGRAITCITVGEGAGTAWGNVVAVAHADGWVSWYAHLDRVLVAAGQTVARGEAIGTVGATGAASRPQLAFRLFRDERLVDPLKYLP
jgi:murein DD-endopeptidase MepM/ murein hydrolase activator NlpD